MDNVSPEEAARRTREQMKRDGFSENDADRVAQRVREAGERAVASGGSVQADQSGRTVVTTPGGTPVQTVSCSAYTLFATLNDMLAQKRIGFFNGKGFASEYEALRKSGIDAVVGSQENRYGVYQMNFVGSKGYVGESGCFFNYLQGPVYQGLVDIVYNHPRLGAPVTWLFEHPLKGIWQASLDADVKFLSEHTGYLQYKRTLADGQNDVRAKAFMNGTTPEAIKSLIAEHHGSWLNPLYAVARAFKGVENHMRVQRVYAHRVHPAASF